LRFPYAVSPKKISKSQNSKIINRVLFILPAFIQLIFIAASQTIIIVFFIVNIVMVLAAGPLNELRSMITGWYRASPGTPVVEGDKP
jgi:thiosulfate reductase cytochrome b subunit